MNADARPFLGLHPGHTRLERSGFDLGAKVEGSQLAGEGFRIALARFGTWNTEHFCPYAHLEQAEQAWRRACPPAEESDGATDGPTRQHRFRPEESLPVRLEEASLTVLHSTAGVAFSTLAALRSNFATRPLPLTAVTYGLAGAAIQNDLSANLLSASLPCDAIVCISRAARSALKAQLDATAAQARPFLKRPPGFAGQMPVIPCGVDTDRFRPRDQAAARDRLGLPGDAMILLSLGRLTPVGKMDLAPLLLALGRVIEKHRGPILLVLGGADGEGYGARILGRAQELGLGARVVLIPDVPPAMVTDLYGAADVFVSISDTVSESQGLTIVEASASGLSVVASDWDGYREFVNDAETGFLIPARWARCDAAYSPWLAYGGSEALLCQAQSVQIDVPLLAERLALLLANADLRRAMGAAGRARAEAAFAWPGIVAAYETLWAELAAIAGRLQCPEGGGPLAAVPAIEEVFSAWASDQVRANTSLGLTGHGARWLDGSVRFGPHPAAEGWLPRGHIEALASWIGGEGQATWGAATEWAALQARLDEQQSGRCLMWLLKHGCLEVLEPR